MFGTEEDQRSNVQEAAIGGGARVMEASTTAAETARDGGAELATAAAAPRQSGCQRLVDVQQRFLRLTDPVRPGRATVMRQTTA